MINQFVFTRFTSLVPKRLTKVFGYSDGILTKESAAYMQEGVAERMTVGSLKEFSACLDSLSSNQAVGFGVTGSHMNKITTNANAPADGEFISRSRKFFKFEQGPGLMMLDHDGMPGDQLDPLGLRQLLIEICPVLASASMLFRPSASYGVFSPDGRLLTSVGKIRAYVAVSNATEIPTAAKKINELLWAARHAWFEVSKSGRLLERSVIDASVFQAERFDFAAPPILNDGLIRKTFESFIVGDPSHQFDLSSICLGEEIESAAKRARARARRDKENESKSRRTAWVEEHSASLAETSSISVDKAKSVLNRAVDQSVLMADFVLKSEDGTSVTVSEILQDAEFWNGKHFGDPLGDYPLDNRVATARLKGVSRPVISSFGHGGQIFELRQQSFQIQIAKGFRIEMTDQAISAIRTKNELFDLGDAEMAYITDDGRARAVTPEFLEDYLGRIIEFHTVHQSQAPDGTSRNSIRLQDVPPKLASAIAAKVGQRGLQKLTAVITAPTLRADGAVLNVPGYDAKSGLYLHSDGTSFSPIPSSPSAAQAIEALRILWEPFSKFPFTDDVSRGVALAAALTACVRSALPAAPGFGIDAPMAGTGKTLLARAIGALANGSDVPVFPPAEKDDEMRKRLFSALLSGQRVVFIDNVAAPLGGAALDAFLTAPNLTERVLGGMTTSSVPNRALFIATGNNLRTRGDTWRRILKLRMDAGIEHTYTRKFPFNAFDKVVEDRFKLVAAALTIIRAWFNAGKPNVGSGPFGSFEAWDQLVRRPLLWLADTIRSESALAEDLPSFDDPLKSIETTFELDSDTAKLSALLHAWDGCFQNTPTTIARAIDCAFAGGESLKEAMEDIAGYGKEINRRVLGQFILNRTEQIVGGLRFIRGRTSSGGVAQWIVERMTQVVGSNPAEPGEPREIRF